MANTDKLKEYLKTISADLDRCVQFWMKHSHDHEHGGFFNCLGKTGTVYDDTKYGWLQGRQVYMYASLYNDVERFRTKEILEAAEKGAAFIMKHLKDPTTWKCYFSLTRDGRPIKGQRTIFCECFYFMAMAELARATKKDLYKDEALGMLEKLIYWVRVDDTDIGRPKLPGTQKTNSLAIPMMLICLLNQLEAWDSSLRSKYDELADWCIEELLAHIQRDGTFILEHVSPDGSELPGCLGRLTLPGHAIEGGWFLLQLASSRQDEDLKKKAVEFFIQAPFKYGWDQKHGGLFYFLDADGLSPTQLEWNMKLWWAHNEALIAFLMAYKETGAEEHLQRFDQVFDYSYKHFCDKENGEWFGYLSQQGDVSLDFKGGPYKGCFHVPRCLLMCEKILEDLLTK